MFSKTFPRAKVVFRPRRKTPREWMQYPFFVYGTLRPGQPNYDLYLRGYTLSEMPARVEDAALYSLGAFPMLIDAPGTGAVVRGEMIMVQPACYHRIMRRLDDLEGCAPGDETSLYRRVRRRIVLESGHQSEAWAWLYVGHPRALAGYPHEYVAGGDWNVYLAARLVDPAR